LNLGGEGKRKSFVTRGHKKDGQMFKPTGKRCGPWAFAVIAEQSEIKLTEKKVGKQTGNNGGVYGYQARLLEEWGVVGV